jgi:uncharacterized LabA/DUF88 family protein
MPAVADMTGAKRSGKLNPTNAYRKRGKNVTPRQQAIISIPNHTPFWSTNRARAQRVMAFIDGGYLRDKCKKFFKHDNIGFSRLSFSLIKMFNTIREPNNPFRMNLIRIYYYDAIVDETHPKYSEQREYFRKVESQYAYTVRLGQLVESSKKRKFKQKGVDLLMGIDSITKAYRNQYDTGMFLIGDSDFIPLIEAVKDSGKKQLLFVSNLMLEKNFTTHLITEFLLMKNPSNHG